jgi:hypothetical protein
MLETVFLFLSYILSTVYFLGASFTDDPAKKAWRIGFAIFFLLLAMPELVEMKLEIINE